MFNINDYIVYGSSGVCKITDMRMLKFKGMDKYKKYYILNPLYLKNSTIYTPVDNTQVVMRRIISKEETDQLIRKIPSIGIIWDSDDKVREQKYKNALCSYDYTEWIKVIKGLYVRKEERTSLGKKIGQIDKRMFNIAEEFLYGELAVTLGIPQEQVENYITSRIENL